MNVVELCGLSRNAGGLFNAVSSLCRSLRKEGGVDLAVYGKNDPFVADDQDAWGDVPTATFKTFGPLESSFRLRRMLVRCRPDVVHLHGLWQDDQWAVLQWQRKTHRPVVVSPHGMLDPWAVRNSAWKKKLVGALFARQALHEATCIHALCQSEVESIRAYGLKNPIAVIPNGVELPEIGKRKTEDGGRKQLLFLGRIHPKKGLDELLQAWAKVQSLKSKAFSNWQLLIAGWDDGGHEAGLKALADELGLSGAVSFVGSKYGDEKETLLRSVDAFVLPSFSEGLPMSVLEAWSYELPVVMTDFCNLPEGFEMDAAIRVDPVADSILRGLEQLVALSDADLRTMGVKGRELVEERFAWARIAREMKAVYEWCLGGDNPDCLVEG